MSAFNYVEVDEVCPACRQQRKLSAQVHVAASYAGDERGRFHDKTYQLGQAMDWWRAEDPRHAGWADGGDPAHRSPVQEACYATCSGCQAQLCVILEFDGPRPSRAAAVTLESQWPHGFLR